MKKSMRTDTLLNAVFAKETKMVYIMLILSGILSGIMVSFNGQLKLYYSTFCVTFLVHFIALVLLVIYLKFIKKQRIRFFGAPKYVYLVGFIGIFLVAASSICTLKIGAVAKMALTTVGDLIASTVIDNFGLFGMPVVRLKKQQIPGYLLVLAGVLIIVFF